MININHIAKLARIGLTAQEKKKFKKELSAILAFVEKLNELKADKIEPTSQATGLENVMRQDKGRAKIQSETEKLLGLAPEKKDRYIKVKAIL